MSCGILWDDLSRAPETVISGSPTVGGLSWSMLADPQPRHRARVAGAEAHILINLGSPQLVRAASLISTNLTASATRRVAIGNAWTADGTTVTADSAAMTADMAVAPLYDSGDGLAGTSGAANGNIHVIAPAAVLAQYVYWRVTDPSVSTIDIGLAPCGPLFVPAVGAAYGSQFGRLDGGSRDANARTGASYSRRGVTLRCATVNLQWLRPDEARGEMDDIDRIVGSWGDVLFVWDAQVSATELSKTAIWGSIRPASSREMMSINTPGSVSRTITMTERL